MRLMKENGEEAGLHDVMKWFIATYPNDVFTSLTHPVHKFRNWCIEHFDNCESKKGGS